MTQEGNRWSEGGLRDGAVSVCVPKRDAFKMWSVSGKTASQGNIPPWTAGASPGAQLGLGAVLWGTHPIWMCPVLSALWWVIWLHDDNLASDYHGIFFPCASFSSTFFARSNSMIHIKNILIPGQHWLTMKKPTRDSQYTPRNKWITIYSHFESVSFSRSNPSVSS